MKFEILQIDLQVTSSVCCRPKILLPWKRDETTSLLYRAFSNSAIAKARMFTHVVEARVMGDLSGN